MPKISIVLPTYNGEKFIKESIDSILEQSFQDWELIVVDDCSTDDTGQIVEEYVKKDTRIRVIHNETNQKLPKSLNIGFSYASGKYLTWTSDDNIYKKDALKIMCEYLCSHPVCPMVRANMDIIDENSIIIGCSPDYIAENIFHDNQVGACFLYRRKVHEQVGDYNVDLYGVEDYDYWLRVVKSCGNIDCIPDNLYQYRRYSSSLSNQKREMIERAKSKMRIQHIDFILENIALETQVLYIYEELVYWGLDTDDLRKKFFCCLPELAGIVYWDKEKPNIIYGAGDYGNRAYTLLCGDVICYIDFSPEQQGKKKNGINIYGIEVLQNMEKEYNLILALSREKLLQAIKYLRSKGIGEYIIFQHLVGAIENDKNKKNQNK